MNALDTIRTALADALNGIEGLQSYALVPGQINPPAAVVAPDSVEYATDFDGSATYRLPVQFLVALGDWASAQKQMDAFVAHDSATVNALDNGTGVESRVVSMEDYGLTSYANIDYLGARLIVEVVL